MFLYSSLVPAGLPCGGAGIGTSLPIIMIGQILFRIGVNSFIWFRQNSLYFLIRALSVIKETFKKHLNETFLKSFLDLWPGCQNSREFPYSLGQASPGVNHGTKIESRKFTSQYSKPIHRPYLNFISFSTHPSGPGSNPRVSFKGDILISMVWLPHLGPKWLSTPTTKIGV